MKHINEYLLSKKNPSIKTKIMQFSNKEETKKFLDEMGYEEIDFVDNFRDKVDSAKQPVYAFGEFKTDVDNWVRFSKGGKDSPIVFWRINNPDYGNVYVIKYAVYMFNLNGSQIEFNNFDDFKDYLEENLYF